MKKVLIGMGALLVVVAGFSVYVLSSLDGIVKDAIETYGSEATRTEVRVADVKIKLKSGEGTIHGLNVGNPKGFTEPNVFELGAISTKIDTVSITKNPIIIDKISISSPAVFYEINKSGISNVDVLKKNLSKAGSASKSTDKSKDGKQLKMIIRKLVVEGGKARVRIAALGKTEKTVLIPRIRLTDVGKKSGGATAAEVAQILGKHLVSSVKGSVAKLGVQQYLGKSADMFKKGAMGKIGGSVGGTSKGVGGALKGLLGK